MPTYEVEHNGRMFEVEAPSLRSAIAAVRKMGATASQPPEAATRGMLPQSTMDSDPSPTTGENLRNVLQWGGNVIAGMTGMGSAGREAVERPATALATAAVPVGAKAAISALAPYGHIVAGAAKGAASALPGAAIVKGAIRGGTRAAKAAKVPSPAAPSAPAPSAPTPPAATGAGTAPTATSAGSRSWSPQRIRNEVGLAVRRQKANLSQEQMEQADALVAKGMEPAEAVRTIAAKVSPTSAARLRLNVEEAKTYVRLRERGKSHEDAAEAIVAMRALTKRHGTPSTEDVIQRVVNRNVTGRWPSAK